MSISSPLLPPLLLLLLALLVRQLLLLLVLFLLWLLLLLGGGGGAVAIAITVSVDFHYSHCKSSLPVMKIRKNKYKKVKKKCTEESRHICVSSPLFPTQYPTIVPATCWLWFLWSLGVGWNLVVEGRKNGGSRANNELKINITP